MIFSLSLHMHIPPLDPHTLLLKFLFQTHHLPILIMFIFALTIAFIHYTHIINTPQNLKVYSQLYFMLEKRKSLRFSYSISSLPYPKSDPASSVDGLPGNCEIISFILSVFVQKYCLDGIKNCLRMLGFNPFIAIGASINWSCLGDVKKHLWVRE